MGVVQQQGLRQVYDKAKQATIAAFCNGGMTLEQAEAQTANGVLTQSYLRLEQPLAINQTLFTFPILKNETQGGNAVRATEKRLNQQDTFFTSNIAVYITKAGSSTATNLVLNTYPNAITYPTGAAALYSFYNGFMQIAINKSVIGPGYDLVNFLQIPQTQLTAATNTPSDQFDPAQVSLWEPNINFVGTKDNALQIVLPGAITALDANVYAVIILRGILAQNVTLMS